MCVIHTHTHARAHAHTRTRTLPLFLLFLHLLSVWLHTLREARQFSLAHIGSCVVDAGGAFGESMSHGAGSRPIADDDDDLRRAMRPRGASHRASRSRRQRSRRDRDAVAKIIRRLSPTASHRDDGRERDEDAAWRGQRDAVEEVDADRGVDEEDHDKQHAHVVEMP